MIEKRTYPDGSFYPIVDLKKFKNSGNNITFRINSYNDLWFLKQIKDVLDYNDIKSDLTIPCLFDGQADSRFNENESNNLTLICEFIESMNWEKVFIFHPHNKEVVQSIIKKVHIIDNSHFIKLVLKNIPNSENLIILAPDAGAYKWIMKTMENVGWKGTILSASKYRKYEGKESITVHELPNFNFENENVLIIDDIIIGGGSCIKIAEKLIEQKCHQIFVAASHITIAQPNPNLWKNFDKVFTTNSKNLLYKDSEIDKFPLNLSVLKLFDETT